MYDASPARLSVLVVDPTLSQRAVTVALLISAFDVQEAHGLTQATAHLLYHPSAILLLELDVPDGDALEWLRHLRCEPRHQHIAIACLTQRATARDKVASFQAGADDYLVKPVDADLFPYRLALLYRMKHLA